MYTIYDEHGATEDTSNAGKLAEKAQFEFLPHLPIPTRFWLTPVFNLEKMVAWKIFLIDDSLMINVEQWFEFQEESLLQRLPIWASDTSVFLYTLYCFDPHPPPPPLFLLARTMWLSLLLIIYEEQEWYVSEMRVWCIFINVVGFLYMFSLISLDDFQINYEILRMVPPLRSSKTTLLGRD